MSDLKLLKDAAKAVGKTNWQSGNRNHSEGVPYWNPLSDDGDALRLAVRLGLTICNDHESAGSVCCTRCDTEQFPEVRSGNVGDPPGITHGDYAATRRAIVRAAAEIGRAA